jgi:hypothetical protein
MDVWREGSVREGRRVMNRACSHQWEVTMCPTAFVRHAETETLLRSHLDTCDSTARIPSIHYKITTHDHKFIEAIQDNVRFDPSKAGKLR